MTASPFRCIERDATYRPGRDQQRLRQAPTAYWTTMRRLRGQKMFVSVWLVDVPAELAVDVSRLDPQAIFAGVTAEGHSIVIYVHPTARDEEEAARLSRTRLVHALGGLVLQSAGREVRTAGVHRQAAALDDGSNLFDELLSLPADSLLPDLEAVA